MPIVIRETNPDNLDNRKANQQVNAQCLNKEIKINRAKDVRKKFNMEDKGRYLSKDSERSSYVTQEHDTSSRKVDRDEGCNEDSNKLWEKIQQQKTKHKRHTKSMTWNQKNNKQEARISQGSIHREKSKAWVKLGNNLQHTTSQDVKMTNESNKEINTIKINLRI